MIHKPIVIVGGGPVGLICAQKLAMSGFNDISILDAEYDITHDTNNKKLQDGRVLALSYASCMFLQKLGIWNLQSATAINEVHISHSGLGLSSIKATDINLPKLGYTVKYSGLCNKLYSLIANYPQVKLVNAVVNKVIPGKNYATVVYSDGSQEQCLSSDLVILAEGGKIKLPSVKYDEFDYNQVAVIARITTQIEHNNIAYERFDNSGAMVLLPHNSSYILVWSVPKEKKEHLLNIKNLDYELQQLKFMKRFGQFELEGKTHAFDLKLQVARQRVHNQVVLVGNSAQAVHPVSAQGLNLGLRDIDSLFELIDTDIEKCIMNLSKYDKLRLGDSKFVVNFTHLLARFADKQYVRHLRGLGLIALSNCRPLQNKLANSLIFGG